LMWRSRNSDNRWSRLPSRSESAASSGDLSRFPFPLCPVSWAMPRRPETLRLNGNYARHPQKPRGPYWPHIIKSSQVTIASWSAIYLILLEILTCAPALHTAWRRTAAALRAICHCRRHFAALSGSKGWPPPLISQMPFLTADSRERPMHSCPPGY